ncbi:DinB family protein [Streptomyces albipurpureus]|uniref:DinB family protein n=1 Tax=Streptomyces albipurpureus TaxID=2897419 RepID=A0ABT0V020_9ACTN|nr:DinB family protein [Streptomyces sp. CWNU-1]MCM2394022.1 DinB family protein [Streptomyces sp. CWNU-1]
MTVARVELLIRQLDTVWALWEYHLPGIDDAACLWEPAPGSWTVRQDAAGHWVADWQVPEPEPVPTTSIGWLTWHMGYWWTTTFQHCFGPGAPAREEIHWPGSAEATVEWLGALRNDWRAELLQLSDADLDSTARTEGLAWGEGLRLVEVAGWITVELTKNVAEVGQLLLLRQALSARGVA